MRKYPKRLECQGGRATNESSHSLLHRKEVLMHLSLCDLWQEIEGIPI